MRFFVITATLLLIAPVASQTLLVNVTGLGPDPSSVSYPSEKLTVGSVTFFSAYHRDFGMELWKTDGTEAGTALVRDIAPGSASSTPQDLVDWNGTLVFSVQLGGLHALWKSDGTQSGTVEFVPPGTFDAVYGMVAAPGHVFLIVRVPSAGRELWRTDGTRAGTVPVPSSQGVPVAAYTESLVIGNVLYFAAYEAATGSELWRSDGTPPGTHIVADIEPGPGGVNPREFAALGSSVLFTAETPATGRELYVTDGTASGTRLVVEMQPGPAHGFVKVLTTWGGAVYFDGLGAGGVRELHRTDGTAAGTQRVAPGTHEIPGNLVAAGSQLFFSADEPTTGDRRLWRTDGTVAGTMSIGPPTKSYIGDAQALGSSLLYVGRDPARPTLSGTEALYVSDGTAAGTTLLGVFEEAEYMERLGNAVMLSVDDGIHGEELWRTDGTVAGTAMVKNINPPVEVSSNPTQLTRSGDRVFFGAAGFLGSDLWVSDGTGPGTSAIHSRYSVVELTDLGGTLFFCDAAISVYSNVELMKSDGTAAGTTVVGSWIPEARGLQLTDLTPFGNVLLFGLEIHALPPFTTPVSREVFRSDGTASGTYQISQITGGTSAEARDFVVAGNLCYFTADDGINGRELWATDGTVGGERLVIDIRRPGSSLPRELVAAGDVLFFVAANTANGAELWRSDGTEAGTYLVKDIVPGPVGSNPRWLTEMQGVVYFAATDVGSGREPWRSDGTAAGTFPVADIAPGPGSSSPNGLTAATDRLFFSAIDPSAGREPFASDGTAAGTTLLRDIHPAGSSLPSEFTAVAPGPFVMFAATEPGTGTETWFSDGTTAGTVQVGDVQPGPGSSFPAEFTRLGQQVLLVATEPSVGRELFVVDLASLGVPIVEPYGQGCPGTSGAAPVLDAVGLPRLGATSFALTIDGAQPSSPGALLLSTQRAALPISGSCSLLVVPWVTLPLVTDGTGSALLPFPVPGWPTLVGAELDAQGVVADPLGQLLGAASATQGLAVLIGK